MKKLPKYTLTYNEKNEKWVLKNDKTDRAIKYFPNKDVATKRNVLKKLLGEIGGSVKIQKVNGRYQEERTYPKSKDPKQSKG